MLRSNGAEGKLQAVFPLANAVLTLTPVANKAQNTGPT